MAYLNWTNNVPGAFEIQVGQGSVELRVNSEYRKTLLEKLREGQSYELRMDLSQGWTVYWKVREGDSRLLLSHPEKDQWVGAVSLNQEDFNRVISWIENPEADVVSLSSLKTYGSFSKVSNLELAIRFLK
ncbi:MAG: hypothetical protein JNL01_12150 [Bdellovibrionales bacterium]|nr:hypothetical protein [Bdellovibrionales bacterium]